MVFDYVNGSLTDQLPNREIDDIGSIIGTKEDGTPFEEIKKINKAIVEATPSVEFDAEYKAHKFNEVLEEIANNRPVIAWVAVEENGIFNHSVVITGVDMTTQLIYYNDHIYGQSMEPIGKFISKWDKVDTILIKLKLGAREQKSLDEWVRER